MILLAVCDVVCSAQIRTTASVESVQTRVERLISEGVSFFERNEREKAKASFEQALALKPDEIRAYTYLGILADQQGDLAEAEKRFSKAVNLAPNSASAHNNFGAVLLKLNRPKEAAVEFESSLRLDGNQSNALVNLAQILSAKGTQEDLRKARDLFMRAYAIQPDVQVARAVVVLSLKLQDQTTASQFFERYSNQLAGSESSIPSAAHMELGVALLEGGLTREAISELNSVVSNDPANVDAVVHLAKAQMEMKDWPAAGRTLEGAIARGLNAAPIYAELASVYQQSGHIDHAIPAMRLAIERDPQSERYRFSYGLLLIDAFAPDAAVIRLKEALELFPTSARLWLALGIAHYKAGRNDEAAKSMLRSIELDPKFAPAYAYLGMTSFEVGQYDDALKRYEQALAINKNLGVVEYLAAEVLQKQGSQDFSLMEGHLARAVKLEPGFAPARLALGKLYFRNERLSEALSEFEQAIKLDPHLAEAYYQIGRVYTKLKRTTEAQTALATFKRLNDSQKEQGQEARKDIVRRLADVLF